MTSWHALKKYNTPHSTMHSQIEECTFEGSHPSLSDKILIEISNDNIKFSSYVIIE